MGPDHLTRAAGEVSRWNETLTLASQATLRPGLPVTRLDATGREAIAFLVSESSAAPVSTAIVEAVKRQRK